MSAEKLLISFSGGKTSAYMTYHILEKHREEYDIQIVFANTGQEHENTLEFVKKCDDTFGFNTVWVEAVTHAGRKGSGHKIVSYETASRDGAPYEEMIQKYGIPNKAYPHCTRELKLNPIHSYIKNVGWKKAEYITAIGIRADEMRRVRKSATQAKIVYPLVDWFPATKPEINTWWEQQEFNLNIQEHQGNCVWCWKKSSSKLLRLVKESPEVFDFPKRMEAVYGLSGHNVDGTKRVFFREHTSGKDLFVLADKCVPEGYIFPAIDNDINNSCAESCELFPMDNKIENDD